MDAVVWLVLIVLLLAIEMFTMGLTTIWFACGSLVAFISTFLGADMWVQLIIFIVISLIMLIFTRPVAVKYINSKRVKTNCDELIGHSVKLTKKVDNIAQTGSAVLEGKNWTVRSSDDSVTYNEGEIVKVVRIEGVKLIVEK